MKIRLGFVSNSSTSSFCIVGFRFDSIKTFIESCKNKKELGLKFDSKEPQYEQLEPIRNILDKKDIATYVDDYDDQFVLIGKNITDMKDSETLGEFKSKVQKDIEEFVDTDKEGLIKIFCGYVGMGGEIGLD